MLPCGGTTDEMQDSIAAVPEPPSSTAVWSEPPCGTRTSFSRTPCTMSPNTRSRGQTSETINACFTRSVVVAGPGFSRILRGGRNIVMRPF